MAQTFHTEFADLQPSGSFAIQDDLYINRDGSNIDKALIYFNSVNASLRYQNNLFRLAKALSVSGSLKTTSDAYVNADESSNNAYAYVYFNGTRGRIRHARRTFGVNDNTVFSGSLATNGDMFINADEPSMLSRSSIYFNFKTASIRFYAGTFTFSGDVSAPNGYFDGQLSTGNSLTGVQISTLYFASQGQYFRYNGSISPRRFQTSSHFEVQGSGSFARLICPTNTVKPVVALTGTMFYDTSDNKLYVKNGTAWKSVTLS